MAEARYSTLPPLEDRPLVTFALFSYNQEKYIREAIKGAFAQTYEPLEIIISDDCSTDRTFEIIEEMAKEYDGPHQVITRRNTRNLGLIKHVNSVCEGASGEFIAFGAGDDVSEAHRIAKCASCFFENPVITLIHSKTLLIDENGNEIGFRKPPFTASNPDLRILAAASGIYIGATGVIRRCTYETFGPISETETYEDMTFGFRAALIGNLLYINEPLVKYRSNIGISSRFTRWSGSKKNRRIKILQHRLATLRQRLKDLNQLEHPERAIVTREIGLRIALLSAQLEFFTAPTSFLRGLLSRKPYHYSRAILSMLASKIRRIR